MYFNYDVLRLNMGRKIYCSKLKQEAEGLAKPPFPGALGEKIFNEVSKQAWTMWLSHQTMLINEYRLNLIEAKARDFLKDEMQKYFFGEGSDKPAGFKEIK
jgi:Fe-S cluster biosynthesis and repair protein YggX